jgi:hypothetical protein
MILGSDDAVFSITFGNTLLLRKLRNSSSSDSISGGFCVRIDIISRNETFNVSILRS